MPPGTLRGQGDGDTSSATRGVGIGSGSKPSRWYSAPTTSLEAEMMQRFEVAYVRDLMNKVYSGEISEPDIAGLVPVVDALARQGDETSMRIMERGAAHLMKLAVVLLEQLGELPVFLSGGVWNAAAMDENFRRLLDEAGHNVEVSRGKGEPWEGIFVIAQGRILEK